MFSLKKDDVKNVETLQNPTTFFVLRATVMKMLQVSDLDDTIRVADMT